MRPFLSYILAFLTLWTAGFASETADAFLKNPVNLRFQSAPLRDILSEISEQTQTFFVYSDTLINDMTISCDVSNEPLDKVLAFILDEHIEYKMIDENLIALRWQPVAVARKPVPKKISEAKKSEPEELHPPRMIKFEKPVYPKSAIKENSSGRVNLFVRIDENGNVTSVIVKRSSGSVILDSTAVKHAKESLFTPAHANKEPVPVWIDWDFDFKLSDQVPMPESIVRP